MKTYTIIPKFTAQDILDSIRKEYTQQDIDNIWEALYFYELGRTQVDDALFEKVCDKWLDRDDKTSFLDPEILEWAEDFDDIEVIN